MLFAFVETAMYYIITTFNALPTYLGAVPLDPPPEICSSLSLIILTKPIGLVALIQRISFSGFRDQRFDGASAAISQLSDPMVH